MKIENTELEYTEADEIVLDYWLGGETETKEKWAQRVWNLCNEYKDTNGKGYFENNYDTKGMPKVYRRSPYELWENKKRKRRFRFYQEMNIGKNTKLNEKILDAKIIANDLNNNKSAEYPPEIIDSVIIEYGKHSNYSTRDFRDEKEKEKRMRDNEKIIDDKISKANFYLRQGRSHEDIILTHPELEYALTKI